VANIVLYVWRGTYNVAVISTTEKDFADEVKTWASLQGYRVSENHGDGPDHK
jgi:hypothetical protein